MHAKLIAGKTAHAGSRTRVTSMGGLYDAATLHALLNLVMSAMPVLFVPINKVKPTENNQKEL